MDVNETKRMESSQNTENPNSGYNISNQTVSDSVNEELHEAVTEKFQIPHSVSNGNEIFNEAQVIISKPLCADYRSDDESADPKSDSTDTVSSSSDESIDSSDSESSRKKWKGKPKMDIMQDLPLIEDLKISVPEEECVEIGTITSIVDLLVVVQSFKGSAALDIDTILFLDCGKRTLGKVFDILGPITEPVYAIRFSSEEQIKSLNIEKNLKVYYAPKTPHTNFVFMSEVLKNRGSDASWKDNVEAPPEFQDFSDDEQERQFKNKQAKEPDVANPNPKDQTRSRKRSFKPRQPGMITPSRFSEGFINSQQLRRSLAQRTPPANLFGAPRPQRPSHFVHPPVYPPNFYYPLRFSRPSIPGMRGGSFFNQQSVYQQTTQAYHQRFEPWGRAVFRHFLPPPPPPPTEQADLQTSPQYPQP